MRKSFSDDRRHTIAVRRLAQIGQVTFDAPAWIHAVRTDASQIGKAEHL